jgi:hypothetical protein
VHNLIVCTTEDLPETILDGVGNEQISGAVDVFSILLIIDDDRFLEWACLTKDNYQGIFTSDREIAHKYDELGRKSVSRRNELPSGLRRKGNVIPVIAHGF